MDPRQRQQYYYQQGPAHQIPSQSHSQQPSNQRFSWQLPLTQLESLPLSRLDSASPYLQEQNQPQNAYSEARRQSPSLQTDALPRDNRYSYMKTPLEYQQPTFAQTAPFSHARRPTEPTIPQSEPTSPVDSEGPTPVRTTAPQRLSASLCKETGSPEAGQVSLPKEYDRAPPQEPHPALFAPVVDRTRSPPGSVTSRSRTSSMAPTSPRATVFTPPPQSPPPHHQQQPYGAVPSSPGPIPLKSGHDDEAEPPAPHHMHKSPTDPRTAYQEALSQPKPIFSPDNPVGPNGLPLQLHQPGQITHPNMDLSNPGSKQEWKHSLCECSADCGTCMTGVFCPCILFGKTAFRLRRKNEKKDPTDLLGWSSFNGSCAAMAATVVCGLCGMFPLFHRTRLRHLYHLEGNALSDAVKACCCCCCAVIQNEREVRDREESNRRWAGPASGPTVYEREEMMRYEPA
ncbi:PLAC8 family-domain-containing protein [Phyllosticta capitalensis]